jgi:hypothetical protein
MTSATQALVIGNSAYPGGLNLNNPARDAAAVKAAFVELGIDVTYAVDFPYDDLLSTIEKFLSQVNRSMVSVSILYYSGHGIQDDNINYIVPVDFKDPTGPGVNRLISIQSIIDRMVNATAIRIVLLDACRTGKDLKQVVATGTRGIEIDRTFKLDNMMVPTQGLAEIKVASDTFIAFAAGPGEVARDGIAGGLLSPFTGALVKHLASVDLPLSNLTSRVRQEVLDETGQTQRTWDQSSLRVPFYFNPGSLLLFVGNLMALIGLIISTVIYSLVLTSPGVTAGWVGAALALPVASFLILMSGTQSVYGRLRGTTYGVRRPSLRRSVLGTLKKGATGGFLGSLACSLFLSAPYYWVWSRAMEPPETFGQLYLEITYGTAFAACVLGACTLTGSLICLSTRGEPTSSLARFSRVLLGSALGGVVTGLIVAPCLTWYYGSIPDRPEMTPWLLLPGSIVGSSLVVFSIINFDLERLSSRRVWTSGFASLCALGAGIPVAFLIFVPLYLFGIVSAVTRFLEANYDNAQGLLEGGAIYGAPVGLVLGLVIGFAVILTQAWSRKPVLT